MLKLCLHSQHSPTPAQAGYVEAAAELRRLHEENKKLKAVLDAARIAMDESTESDDEECSIKIPSHLAASLSLCLDDYDKANNTMKDNT